MKIDDCRVNLAHDLPVLCDGGALVVEGTLAACVSAWLLAQGGCRTVLVTSGASLPTELVVVRQPWARPSQWRGLPEPFQDALRRSVARTLANGVCLLNLSRLAVAVEDLMLDAGVRLFYGLTPCGVRQQRDGTVSHVIFGGKSGLQAIASTRVIDATAGAWVAAAAGARLQHRPLPGERLTVRLAAKVKAMVRPGPVVITRGQISNDRVKPVEETSLPAPGVAELVGDRIPLHGPYAAITLKMKVDRHDPLWPARLSVATRETLVRLGQSVNDQRRAAGQSAVYFHRFSGALHLDPFVRIASRRGDPNAVKGCGNLWVCGPAADVEMAAARRLADPFHACQAVPALVAGVLEHRPARGGAGELKLGTSNSSGPAVGALRWADVPSLHTIGSLPRLRSLTLPVLDDSDVLVVGAGTSGVPAALAAGGAKARTTIIDQNADVGGVRTVGGVASYWFGRPTPFQRACDDAYDRVTGGSGVAEEVAMTRCLLDAGVQVLAPCPVVGTVVRRGQVLGAVVIAAGRLALLRGKMIVDATGDADLAAWAGAPFEFGNGRDAFTLWGSFGNFNHDKRTANRQYESTIEVRDAWDLTRTIVRARRRPGMWRALEHEMPQHYVTPRETRRIVADATVSYSGILAGETFPDLCVVCESNFDIKGLATSDLIACGVISDWDVYRKFQAAVPWQALLPRGLDNLIVAGRAYSASHDAIALARMQKDMVALGGAAGVAAARAAAAQVAPARLDVAVLQRDWLTLGTLRPDDHRRYAKPWKYTSTDAEADCQALLARRGPLSRRLARLMRSPVSLEALRRALAVAPPGLVQVRLARALACLGDTTGAPVLLASIQEQIADGLPRPLKKTLAIPPEHGWAGEPVYSLRALGFTDAAEQAAPLMVAIARKVEDSADRFGSKTESQFEYVQALCAVAERRPGPAFIQPLNILLSRRALRNQSIPHHRDMRFTEDPVPERRAYLELSLGRALARCGDVRGYEILERYTRDIRGTLARSAREELADLLGKPWPAEPAPQRRLLQQHLARPLPLRPFTRRLD